MVCPPAMIAHIFVRPHVNSGGTGVVPHAHWTSHALERENVPSSWFLSWGTAMLSPRRSVWETFRHADSRATIANMSKRSACNVGPSSTKSDQFNFFQQGLSPSWFWIWSAFGCASRWHVEICEFRSGCSCVPVVVRERDSISVFFEVDIALGSAVQPPCLLTCFTIRENSEEEKRLPFMQVCFENPAWEREDVCHHFRPAFMWTFFHAELRDFCFGCLLYFPLWWERSSLFVTQLRYVVGFWSD